MSVSLLVIFWLYAVGAAHVALTLYDQEESELFNGVAVAVSLTWPVAVPLGLFLTWIQKNDGDNDG